MSLFCCKNSSHPKSILPFLLDLPLPARPLHLLELAILHLHRQERSHVLGSIFQNQKLVHFFPFLLLLGCLVWVMKFRSVLIFLNDGRLSPAIQKYLFLIHFLLYHILKYIFLCFEWKNSALGLGWFLTVDFEEIFWEALACACSWNSPFEPVSPVCLL